MLSPAPHLSTPGDTKGLSHIQLTILAMAAGLNVANIYYAQPLLTSIGEDLRLEPASLGLIVTCSQIGYALGLMFLVPLGDLIDRRRLVIVQGILSTLALLSVAMAQTAGILLASLALMGVLAVAVQVLVSFAAGLARPQERGRAVGIVTSGVVCGILAARVFAGILADIGGWRLVYVTSALLTLCMAGLLMRKLPGDAPRPPGISYAGILRSIPHLFWNDKFVLLRGILAFFIFAAFSTFWTGLTLALSDAPFHYTHSQIGLFGLIGLIGALAAGAAGRLADRGIGERTTSSGLVLLLLSWGLVILLPLSMLALIAGILLLDLAVQAVHVTSQSLLFARHPQAQSRLVAGYMVFYAAGSGSGAALSGASFQYGGWMAVSALGAGFSLGGLLIWAMARPQPQDPAGPP